MVRVCVIKTPMRTRRRCGYPCGHGNATPAKEFTRTELNVGGWGGGQGSEHLMQPPRGWHKETVVGTGARLTLWCCGPHLLHGLRWGVERGREPASTANDTLNPSRGSIKATFTTREGQRLGRFSIKLGRPAGLDIDAVVKHALAGFIHAKSVMQYRQSYWRA